MSVTDLELMEGLDSSKHGERAMSVVALVKELDASVRNGVRAKDGVEGNGHGNGNVPVTSV